MSPSPPRSSSLPPRLSMDEYADFVEASLRAGDQARAARQKELEERITTPFRMRANFSQELVRRSRALLRAESNIRLALLYGSLATGKVRLESDVDIEHDPRILSEKGLHLD
ncbi:MAG: hypothetical protein NTV49_02235 [Kiritimatiellaeota bacterium]|nr:hypothetical protein [Kiritimatiellota bacterium]